jgi:carboxyl-terminal processing protease
VNPGAVCFEFVYASLDTLDKFSMFLAPEKSGEVSIGLDQKLVGIGVEVEADPSGLKILKAFPGGPAAQATLKKGDLITAVNGRSLQGVDLARSVELITGPAGSPVKLGLRREDKVAELTLVRRSVEVASVSEVRMLDDASHVGYIRLDQFAESSTKELDAALWKLHNAGMETLVLDLRGNPGGYLTTAIEISDRFLPSGTIVSTRGRNAEDNSQETAQFAQTWKTPLVVLIDHQSASASEIFAAAIQENGRGLIVGETSYGKGTVQTLFPLKSVTAGLRLTTAKFYSPDGREMAGAGVTPDIKVRTGTTDDDAAMLQAGLNTARDPQLQTMADRLGRPNRTGLRTFQVSSTR